MVIDQQYNQSVDSTGEPLRAYSLPYTKHKELAGHFRGKTDFNDTGEFHSLFNVAIDGEMYIIESPAMTDKGELKSEWLENWNGAPIMDLTPENREIAKAELSPKFAEKLAEMI